MDAHGLGANLTDKTTLPVLYISFSDMRSPDLWDGGLLFRERIYTLVSAPDKKE